MCWQTRRNNGGGDYSLIFFGNPLGALMQFPQLGDLKVCAVCSLTCVFVCSEKKRQNAVNNKLLLQKKKMPQEKSCQTQFLWGVILRKHVSSKKTSFAI